MYEQYYGMTDTPFSRNVPPEALYESPAMADTLGRLAYAADKQLFAVVTSDAGCGKTTTIRKFAASLPKEDYILLYLSDSKLTPRWFYKGMLDQLGLESRFYRGDAKRQLQKEIEIIRGVHHQKVVCVLDEAHLLQAAFKALCRCPPADRYQLCAAEAGQGRNRKLYPLSPGLCRLQTVSLYFQGGR